MQFLIQAATIPAHSFYTFLVWNKNRKVTVEPNGIVVTWFDLGVERFRALGHTDPVLGPLAHLPLGAVGQAQFHDSGEQRGIADPTHFRRLGELVAVGQLRVGVGFEQVQLAVGGQP